MGLIPINVTSAGPPAPCTKIAWPSAPAISRSRTQRIQIVWTQFAEFATAREILPDQALSNAKRGESIRVGSDTITILPPGSK